MRRHLALRPATSIRYFNSSSAAREKHEAHTSFRPMEVEAGSHDTNKLKHERKSRSRKISGTSEDGQLSSGTRDDTDSRIFELMNTPENEPTDAAEFLKQLELFDSGGAIKRPREVPVHLNEKYRYLTLRDKELYRKEEPILEGMRQKARKMQLEWAAKQPKPETPAVVDYKPPEPEWSKQYIEAFESERRYRVSPSEGLVLSERQLKQFPQSPLTRVQNFWTEKAYKPKPKAAEVPTEFQRKLHRNPYALTLASSVRCCLITKTRLPKDFLISFEALSNPADGQAWFLPRDLTMPIPAQGRKSKNGKKRPRFIIPDGFTWRPEHKDAFEALKKALSERSKVASNGELMSYLEKNASQLGISVADESDESVDFDATAAAAALKELEAEIQEATSADMERTSKAEETAELEAATKEAKLADRHAPTAAETSKELEAEKLFTTRPRRGNRYYVLASQRFLSNITHQNPPNRLATNGRNGRGLNARNPYYNNWQILNARERIARTTLDDSGHPKQVGWRPDIDTFVLDLMRKRAIGLIWKSLFHKDKLVRYMPGWDRIAKEKQLGCIIWLGDEALLSGGPRDESPEAKLEWEARVKNEILLGPEPYTMLNNEGFWKRKEIVHNGLRLLGVEGIGEIRLKGPPVDDKGWIVVKDKNATVELRRWLWKIENYIGAGGEAWEQEEVTVDDEEWEDEGEEGDEEWAPQDDMEKN